MHRLAICLAPLLLTGAVVVAQDTSSRQQTSSSISQDSTTPASDRKTGAGDARQASEAKGEHKYHLRLGTVTVGAGYFSGPFFYPYGPYRWYPYYSGAFWDPYWGPYGSVGYLPDLAYGYDKGEVKLTADPKQAAVHIDGAYAGTADRLKTIWLEPGAYDLSLSYTGRESFHQRIYVLTGKSLKIAAKLAPQNPATAGKEEQP
jgi:PEGA domain-containing protein